MKCLPDLTYMLREPLATILPQASGSGAGGPATFRVWGFHPLLRVVTYVYFQQTAGTGFAGAHVWSASALKRDPKGGERTLQAIFSALSLEDGHEVNSAAEGILYSCTFDALGNSARGGTWWAELWAMPEQAMDRDFFKALCDRVRLDCPSKVPVYFSNLS